MDKTSEQLLLRVARVIMSGIEWSLVDEIKEWSENHLLVWKALKKSGNQPVKIAVIWPGMDEGEIGVILKEIDAIFEKNSLPFEILISVSGELLEQKEIVLGVFTAPPEDI
mgnify:CR=1 FL=1